jgi:hypothetical protein
MKESLLHIKQKTQVPVRTQLAKGKRPVSAGNVIVSVRFEVFTAVTMKNAVFCDVTPCDTCKNRRFGGT